MSWFEIVKRTGKSKGTGLRGRGYKSPKDSTSRRKENEKDILEPDMEALQKNCGCGKTPCETYGKVNKKEGVPHYTEDGQLWEGKKHKMGDGSLMTGDPHDENSVRLYHKEELK